MSVRGELVVFTPGNIDQDQMWWAGLNEKLGSLDFILQWFREPMQVFDQKMTQSCLYFKTISQDGLGGDAGCKKTGGLKKHCCLNTDIEILSA